MRSAPPWCWVLLMLLVGALGCRSEQERRPGIDELRAIRGENRTSLDPLPDTTFDRPAAMQVDVEVVRLDLPLDQPTDAAWALSRLSGLDVEAVRLWQANGLRVAAVSTSDLSNLAEALPPTLGQARYRVVASGDMVPLAVSPRLPDDLEVPVLLRRARGDRPDQNALVAGGRMRLLVRMGPDGAGGLYAEFWLQHWEGDRDSLSFEPTESGGVRVLTPSERSMEGWLMQDLVCQAQVPRGQALMIGLDRPWPRVVPGRVNVLDWPAAMIASTVMAGPSYRARFDPATRPAFAFVPTPPLDTNLGRTLMVNQRAAEPVQQVLVIRAR